MKGRSCITPSAQFIVRKPNVLLEDRDYSRYMRDKTFGVDIPMKNFRDKFFVHQGPDHLKLFTIVWEGDDNRSLPFILTGPGKILSDASIDFNPWRMS